MAEAIACRSLYIGHLVRAVHWLKKKVLKVETFEAIRIATLLWINKLQFVAGGLNESRASFWADTNPVEALRCRDSAVGFYRDAEALRMQRADERIIQLQQWFAAGANDIWLAASGPFSRDGCRKKLRIRELAAARSVVAHEIRIAELADGAISIPIKAIP